jgi:hypothetical protein
VPPRIASMDRLTLWPRSADGLQMRIGQPMVLVDARNPPNTQGVGNPQARGFNAVSRRPMAKPLPPRSRGRPDRRRGRGTKRARGTVPGPASHAYADRAHGQAEVAHGDLESLLHPPRTEGDLPGGQGRGRVGSLGALGWIAPRATRRRRVRSGTKGPVPGLPAHPQELDRALFSGMAVRPGLGAAAPCASWTRLWPVRAEASNAICRLSTVLST